MDKDLFLSMCHLVKVLTFFYNKKYSQTCLKSQGEIVEAEKLSYSFPNHYTNISEFGTHTVTLQLA